MSRVQEAVGVEALGGVCEISEGEVEGEDENEEGDVQRRRRAGGGDDDLKEGEERVEAVLGDLYHGKQGRKSGGALAKGLGERRTFDQASNLTGKKGGL